MFAPAAEPTLIADTVVVVSAVIVGATPDVAGTFILVIFVPLKLIFAAIADETVKSVILAFVAVTFSVVLKLFIVALLIVTGALASTDLI